jgi:UDP-N-acetylglucosamine 2-epimerase (non-hydrolysing)
VQTAPQVLAAVDALLQPFAGRRLMAVTVHRRENQGRPLATIAAGLAHLAARPDVALIYPLHPNPDIRRVMHAQLGQCPNVALIEPLDYPSFVALLDRVDLVLTDSGGIQEEAPALGKPVLVVRDRTERPEGLAAGTALLVGTQSAQIVAAVTQLLEDAQAYAQMARAHNPYGDGKAADQIARILVHES